MKSAWTVATILLLICAVFVIWDAQGFNGRFSAKPLLGGQHPYDAGNTAIPQSLKDKINHSFDEAKGRIYFEFSGAWWFSLVGKAIVALSVVLTSVLVIVAGARGKVVSDPKGVQLNPAAIALLAQTNERAVPAASAKAEAPPATREVTLGDTTTAAAVITQPSAGRKGRRRPNWIAIIAATATVCSIAGNMLKSEGQEWREKAEKCQQDVLKARAQVKDAGADTDKIEDVLDGVNVIGR